jgi:hypothetical protein
VSIETLLPDTVQTVVVVEAKLTGRPLLAVAYKAKYTPTTWGAMAGKVMV